MQFDSQNEDGTRGEKDNGTDIALLEQLLDNPVVSDLGHIATAVVEPAQHVNLEPSVNLSTA